MSVVDHRRNSREHAIQQRAHRDRYDPEIQIEAGPDRSSSQGRWRTDYDYLESGDYYWGGNSYNPSEYHLDLAADHEALAKEHRLAAETLEQFEEAQCRSFPPETRVLCPLLGQSISTEDVEDGIRVRFVGDVDMNAVIAHLRCHIAFARARAHTGMGSCPLYLEGVRVSRVGTSSAVDFQVQGRNELKTLRNRVRRHVTPGSR